MKEVTDIILWGSLTWTAFTLLLLGWAIIDARRHRRPKATPRKPTPPTPPAKPWNGMVLPRVEVKPYRSPQQKWLDQWRAEQSLVAHPHIGEPRNLIHMTDYRKVAVR